MSSKFSFFNGCKQSIFMNIYDAVSDRVSRNDMLLSIMKKQDGYGNKRRDAFPKRLFL